MIRKIAVEILQSVNNRMESWEILRMIIIVIVINTLLGILTLDPAGMHCPAWDDAFVSIYHFFLSVHPFLLRHRCFPCSERRRASFLHHYFNVSF